MKILSRDFTAMEKVLILILCLVLVGLAYYFLVYRSVRSDVEAANAERDALKIELTQAETKLNELRLMQEEIDSLGTLENVSRMGSYNNSKAEISMLNNILTSAESYSISFSGVTRDGDQIRRDFSLQFTAGSYAQVKQIVAQLAASEYRCLIKDLHYSGGGQSGAVSVSATATFFETMYDGTPDIGLPGDAA